MTWHPLFTALAAWLHPQMHWAYRSESRLLHRVYFFVASRAWWDAERRAGRLS